MTNQERGHVDDIELVEAKRRLNDADGPDERARAYLTLGCLSEQREHWDRAVSYYCRVLAEASQIDIFRYFGNNNLGYSLIQLGRFDEAEAYCLAAIELNLDQHNAHKNLGLVRQGQKRWLEAAFCFTEAYRLCPQDPRAWHLLSTVLTTQPGLLKASRDLRMLVTNLSLHIASNENLPQ